MALRRVIAQSMLAAAAVLTAPCAFADDAPVERPAVDRPALPQPNPSHTDSSPAPAHASGQREVSSGSRQGSSARGATQTGDGGRNRTFVYVAAGAGALSGLSGGQDFERTNPALTGTFGVEIPLGHANGLGFELNGDLELAAQADRGTYTALLLRARFGHMLSPRNRLWGAVGLGGAGYQTSSLAFGLAAGTSLMLVPKFGLDLSANLAFLGASNSNNAGIQNDYSGGAVLMIALRGLFELHR